MSMSPSVLERLRKAGFKLTVARISVLQVIEAQQGKSICAEDVHRHMVLHGMSASIGTVYRNIHQMEQAGLLQRRWSAQRTAVYSITTSGRQDYLQVVCSESGRSFALADADLHARLLAAAKREGLELDGRAISVHVTCAGCNDHACPSHQGSRPIHPVRAYDIPGNAVGTIRVLRRSNHQGDNHANSTSAPVP